MKEKKVLDYPYEIKDITLNKASMSRIDIVNQRQMRNSQVMSLLRALNKGEHFDSMFVVNINNGTNRIRIIDGGHRTEAIRRYFETHPEAKIKVSMAVYKDLTNREEREIYTKWNIGVKQNVDDFINSYKAEIPMYEEMLSRLPISIYGSKNKMKIRHMVDAYMGSKQNPFKGGCGYNRDNYLSTIKKIDEEDVENMEDTFKIIKEIFNPNDVVDFMRLSAFKTTLFRAIFRLVHINKVFLGKNYVIKKMSKVLYKSSILESIKVTHRQGTVEAYIIFKQLLNKNAKHQFR